MPRKPHQTLEQKPAKGGREALKHIIKAFTYSALFLCLEISQIPRQKEQSNGRCPNGI